MLFAGEEHVLCGKAKRSEMRCVFSCLSKRVGRVLNPHGVV